MEKLGKISFVKFYQAVQIDSQNGLVSIKPIDKISATSLKTVKVERSDLSVIVTTCDQVGRTSVAEIPFNNVAYINYEPTHEDSEQKAKSPNAVKPKSASSEQK